MRSNFKRVLVGAVLLAGIMGLSQTRSEAVDPLPANEFNSLVTQDVKNLEALLAMAQKGGKANESKASRGMKSSAMMIALYADARIDGTNAANDAKMATLRDAAIDIAKAAGNKNFRIGAQVKALGPNMKAVPGVNAKPMAVAALIAASNLDAEEMMYQFKKAQFGGLGIEQDVKAYANNGNAALANGKLLALRLLVAAEYVDALGPAGGFAPPARIQRAWLAHSADMKAAATEFLTEMQAKKPDPNKLAAAFTKVDGACVRCHQDFK